MNVTICRSCGQEIREGYPHRVRIQLVNAKDPNHPTCLKEDDFHHACAASIFAVFDGRDFHPRRPKLKDSLVAAPPETDER